MANAKKTCRGQKAKAKKTKGAKANKNKKIDYPIPRLGQQAAKAYTNGQKPKI